MTEFDYEGRPQWTTDVPRAEQAPYIRRLKARRAVAGAVHRGKLVKPTVCPVCGRRDVPPRQMHAHHADYDKPREIAWSCNSCHMKAHREHDAATRDASPREGVG